MRKKEFKEHSHTVRLRGSNPAFLAFPCAVAHLVLAPPLMGQWFNLFAEVDKGACSTTACVGPHRNV